MREAPVLAMVIAERNSAVDSHVSGLGSVVNPLVNDASVFPALSRKVSSVWHVTLNELVALPPVRKRTVISRTVKSVVPESSPCFAASKTPVCAVVLYGFNAVAIAAFIAVVLLKEFSAVAIAAFIAVVLLKEFSAVAIAAFIAVVLLKEFSAVAIAVFIADVLL